MQNSVYDNVEQQRYELKVEGGVVFADYRRSGNEVSVIHTETPVQLQGQGLASKLVKGIITDARERGLLIVPRCSFVVDYFARHPEDQDVLPPRAAGHQ